MHPTYNDGFGYAPVEALACGVPVIVTQDTGMKDLIERDGADGAVVPTGDLAALAEAIDVAYRGESARPAPPARQAALDAAAGRPGERPQP